MGGKAAGLLTLDYNFGGTSHSGIDVPRIVGSENRLSCMIYDVSRRGYDRSYPNGMPSGVYACLRSQSDS